MIHIESGGLFRCVHAYAGVIMAASGDPSSSSNFSEVVVKHFDWQLEVDFASQKLLCVATLQACTLAEGVAELVSAYVGSLAGLRGPLRSCNHVL